MNNNTAPSSSFYKDMSYTDFAVHCFEENVKRHKHCFFEYDLVQGWKRADRITSAQPGYFSGGQIDDVVFINQLISLEKECPENYKAFMEPHLLKIEKEYIEQQYRNSESTWNSKIQRLNSHRGSVRSKKRQREHENAISEMEQLKKKSKQEKDEKLKKIAEKLVELTAIASLKK